MSERDLDKAIEQAAAARQVKYDEIRRKNFVKATEYFVDQINNWASVINGGLFDWIPVKDNDDPRREFFREMFWFHKEGDLEEMHEKFKDDKDCIKLNVSDLWRICDSLETFPNYTLIKLMRNKMLFEIKTYLI